MKLNIFVDMCTYFLQNVFNNFQTQVSAVSIQGNSAFCFSPKKVRRCDEMQLEQNFTNLSVKVSA